MKVIIIDDEPLARAYIRECLQSFPQCEVLAECADGFEGFKAINSLQPDLIFLDIQMPRINGFEMLELLEAPPQVIFTTAFDSYAIKAFEANALDYLLKPFDKERFGKAMLKVTGKSETPTPLKLELPTPEYGAQNRLVLRHNGEIRIVPVAEVLYLEAWDDYVKIHTAQQVFVKKQTLSYYENSLSKKEFVRCHRGFMVNVSHISALDHGNQELRLRNGFHLPVSKTGYTKLKETLGL